jgi:hypothetical protein
MKTDNLLIRINADLKDRFKRLCEIRGETITDNLTDHIKEELKDDRPDQGHRNSGSA